jgi:putative methanogenesis marker protein 8
MAPLKSLKLAWKLGYSTVLLLCVRGAGTVMTSNPSLVQGIGAHLTGIIETSPIKQTINHIQTNGGRVLDLRTARINQTEGVEKAAEAGFKKIAVTVAGFQARQISAIRKLEKKLSVGITIFSVCNTCTGEKDVRYIVDADIVTASASQVIRKQIGPKALMQVGVTIPVYALTQKGKETILTYLTKFNDKIVAFRTQLPYLVEGREPTLKPS